MQCDRGNQNWCLHSWVLFFCRRLLSWFYGTVTIIHVGGTIHVNPLSYLTHYSSPIYMYVDNSTVANKQ